MFIINPWIIAAQGITVGTIDSDVATANNTTFSFTLNAGTEDAARSLLIAVGVGGGSTGTISSLLVGGSATGVVLLKDVAINGEAHARLYGIDYPTGGTASLEIGCSGSKGHCGAVVLPVYNVDINTTVDTANSSANPATDTIDVNAGGIVFAYEILASSTDRTFAWTNLDELLDETIEGSDATHTAAATVFASAEAGKTITCTPSGAATNGQNMIAVSLGS